MTFTFQGITITIPEELEWVEISACCGEENEKK